MFIVDVIMLISASFLGIWIIGVAILKASEWFGKTESYYTTHRAIKQMSIITCTLGIIISTITFLIFLGVYLFRQELLA